MDFTTAINLVNKNSHLINKSFDGGPIDEIIACPTDPNDFENFIKKYILEDNPHEAIKPYKNKDLTIIAIVDKDSIDLQSRFQYIEIFKIPAELKPILE